LTLVGSREGGLLKRIVSSKPEVYSEIDDPVSSSKAGKNIQGFVDY
jgi:hypothetical protein